MVDTNDYSDLVDSYVEEAGVDQNEKTGGGGSFSIPDEGKGYARIVEYIELGAHMGKPYKGVPKKNPDHRVRITFELLGKLWPAVEGENSKYFQRITLTLNLSTNERARFYKLFRAMNKAHGDKYKHMAQMAAENAAFKIEVIHNSTGEGDQANTYANMDDENGWKVDAPVREDEDGNEVAVKVPPANIPTRIFLFNKPRLVDWDKLFVEGVNDKNESRNRIQNQIKDAVNYPGSPVEAMLSEISTPDEAPKGESKKGAKGAAKTNSKTDDLGDFEDDIPF